MSTRPSHVAHDVFGHCPVRSPALLGTTARAKTGSDLGQAQISASIVRKKFTHNIFQRMRFGSGLRGGLIYARSGSTCRVMIGLQLQFLSL